MGKQKFYFITVGVGVLIVMFSLFFWRNEHGTTPTEGATTVSSNGGNRNLAADLRVPYYKNLPVDQNIDSTKEEVTYLNNIIYRMPAYGGKSANHVAVADAAQTLIDYASKKDSSYAARYYGAYALLIKPTKALLWRLGGIVASSEHIYVAVVGGLQQIIYNQHLYSPSIRRAFDYLTIPDATSTRFEKISDFQYYLRRELIPALEACTNELIKLHTQSAQSMQFEFLYDRALVAYGGEQNAAQERYVRFIRPYLSASIFYNKLALGASKLFVSYSADELPDFMNSIMWSSIEKSKLRLFKLSEWNKGGFKYNVHINGSADYKKLLAGYPNLFRLIDTSDRRREALTDFQQAQNFNLEYIGQMRAYAEIGNQDEFIVDATALTQLPDQQPEKYEKLAKTMYEAVDYTDPVSGKSVTLNFPKLFSLPNKDLKAYYPEVNANGAEKFALANDRTKEYFNYAHGRPQVWSDPTFNGFITGANSLYEAHRILSYSDDGDALANTILPFFM